LQVQGEVAPLEQHGNERLETGVNTSNKTGK
jgi:hypothetical protein